MGAGISREGTNRKENFCIGVISDYQNRGRERDVHVKE
jgi:hypothetical protein